MKFAEFVETPIHPPLGDIRGPFSMKRKFIMMPVLIPGPKQPGNDIRVYLKPLVDDLLLLWKEEGVAMWDAHAEEHFNLRALLFVTTNDRPALSKLSGQSNKGYRACTHCLEETNSMYLKHCRRSCTATRACTYLITSTQHAREIWWVLQLQEQTQRNRHG